MRQRNVKNLEERIESNGTYLVSDPKEMKGHWHALFGNDRPIFLEIGCGKGRFIMTKAANSPDKNFIAVEGQSNVMLRALEKAEENKLENIRLFIDYIDHLEDYFERGELDGIYLNFSDPWPKARHDKRRLTYHKRLENYFRILDDDGFVEFKTDNVALFDFTLEEIQLAGLEAIEQTRDLHHEGGKYESGQVTTEYEEKFKSVGKPIHYVKIVNK